MENHLNRNKNKPNHMLVKRWNLLNWARKKLDIVIEVP
jgi:hypothetical protein